MLLSIKRILHGLVIQTTYVVISLVIVILLLRLHPHQPGFVTNSNDFKKLTWCNFQSFVYTATPHLVVPKYLNVWQHDRLVIPIKMFLSSLTVLKQQRLGMTDYIHSYQTQLMKSCLVVWFWLYKRPVFVSFSIKNNLDTQTRFAFMVSEKDINFIVYSKIFLSL